MPGWVVVKGKDLLDAFGPAAALVVQDFECLADLFQARIPVHGRGSLAAADAVEDGGNFQDLAADFEEVGV